MAEIDIPQKKPRKHGRWLVLATMGVLLLCCAPLGWQYYRVAAVQGAVVRNWEIMFDKEGRPEAMPKVLDDKLIEFLGNRENRWGEEIPYEVYRERARAMFRGGIEEMIIFEHHGFRGDLGAALLHFPELKKFTVFENGELMPTEAELKLLCLRLRDLPVLEELEIAGDRLSNDVLAQLAGHPKLQKLTISYSTVLTTDVLETFKTLPALRMLEVGGIYGPDEDEWKSPVLHARFRKNLPWVTLTLPES